MFVQLNISDHWPGHKDIYLLTFTHLIVQLFIWCQALVMYFRTIFLCERFVIIWHELNKRPMSHIAHLRKQFKSIHAYDHIITLIRRRENSLSSFWEMHGSLFEQTSTPFTQGCFVQTLVQTVPMVLEKIFKFCQCIFVTS